MDDVDEAQFLDIAPLNPYNALCFRNAPGLSLMHFYRGGIWMNRSPFAHARSVLRMAGCALLILGALLSGCARTRAGLTMKPKRPILWQEALYDGKAEHLSDADRHEAEAIVARYFANFARIQSIQFRHTGKITALSHRWGTGSYVRKQRKCADNDFEVDARRAPLYLRMSGQMGGGPFDEIVEADGVISSGKIDYAESFVPAFLDGVGAVSKAGIKEVTRVRRGLLLNERIAWLEPWLSARSPRTRYDVLEYQKKNHGRNYNHTQWFNQKTGMLDFIIVRDLDHEDDPYARVAAFAYQHAGGIAYCRDIVTISRDPDFQTEESVSALIINGVAARDH